MKSTLAVLAAIVGVLLVLVALLFPVLAFVAGQIEKPPILGAVATVFALGLLGGVPLIRFAGRALCYSRVLQIGLGAVLAVCVAFLGRLQYQGVFDRSKASLDDGVLLIQGQLDDKLLASFRRVLDSNDLRDVRVRLRSPGGSTYVGMVIGREIHRRHLDVEVDRRCSSSCANYLFTAGRKKYVKSPDQVQFHGGGLQPNYVEAALMLIEQGKQMVTGEDMPAGLDPKQLREIYGLVDDFPFNPVGGMLAEKAYFDEIAVSMLTPVYGQYGDYATWFNDGMHDSFFYLPEDYALLGVTDVIVTGAKPGNGLGSKTSLFRAKTSVATINALQTEMTTLYRKVEAAMPFGTGDIWRSAVEHERVKAP